MTSIRPLSRDDAEALRQIRLGGLEESPTAFGSSYAQEAARPIECFTDRVSANDDKWVLGSFDGNSLVGVIGFVRNAGEKERHKEFVWGFYVLPVHRGKGVGRLLFSEMMKRVDVVPGLRAVQLSVVASNLAAVKLYEAFGFSIYGTEAEALCVGGTFHAEYHMVRRIAGGLQAAEADPEAIVQRQLEAFNARDLEAISETYAADAEQFGHPLKPLAAGMTQLREGWTHRFGDKNLHATLLHRTVIGATVIDSEIVTRTFA
ncbi:MAG: GNAT family N-acetyltransferase [Opitutaceae bacterium]